jgi:hypothetical protein
LQPEAAEQAQAQANSAAETAVPMMQPGTMQSPMVQAWQAMMNPMGLNGAPGASAAHH